MLANKSLEVDFFRHIIFQDRKSLRLVTCTTLGYNSKTQKMEHTYVYIALELPLLLDFTNSFMGSAAEATLILGT